MFFNVFAGFTSALVALVYPVYSTLEGITKNDTGKLKNWSGYFVVLSLLHVLELGDFLPSLVPFYYVLKSVLVLWLYLPQYKVGCCILYYTMCFYICYSKHVPYTAREWPSC